MFWTEDDIAPAVKVACELFGQQGVMSETKTVRRNVVIGTNKFGKIWYGDVDTTTDIEGLLSILSYRIGQPAMLVSENF
jgi:hypothetical protein